MIYLPLVDLASMPFFLAEMLYLAQVSNCLAPSLVEVEQIQVHVYHSVPLKIDVELF